MSDSEVKGKNPVGRPRMYDSPQKLQEKITEYFTNCPDYRIAYDDKHNEIRIPTITISGLVLYCGFCDRKSFYAYEEFPEFSHTIKKARTFIEMEYEKLLRSGNCTGAIFALKNFGWKDKSEIDQTMVFQKMPTIKTDDGKELKFIVGDE